MTHDPGGAAAAGERTGIELYLLRHADAGDPETWTGDDDERPLTRKGRRQAKRLGTFLAEMDFKPGLVVSSPKVRARETAELVAQPLKLKVRIDERLGYDLGLGALDSLLGDLGERRPVLVGHDPDFSALVAILCGASRVPMKKGGLARIDVEPPLQPGAGVLRWLVPPDLLKREAA